MKTLAVFVISAVLAAPALGVESGKPGPKGNEQDKKEEGKAPEKPKVELHIDAAGKVRVLPADMAGKGAVEAEVLELKPAGLKAALEAILKACAAAPRKTVDLPSEQEEGEHKPKPPVRLLLRWNPTISKCKFYLGQVLCNYDEQGLARAGAKIKASVESGAADSVEIDAGPEVPIKWVLSAVAMVRESGVSVENTRFTAAVNPLGDEPDAILDGLDRKKHWSEKDGRRSFPEIELLIRVSPETEWRYVQFIFQECVLYGALEVSLGSAPGEKVTVKFPAYVAVQEEEKGAMGED